ncbi:hypothetical protein AVEN_6511-1 [Araneus ventricosus]|uniref:Uncharacterized protein n=1 Tax=Araneus ventricosus TaxID=182803 RepID=A0A4Y2UA19_ARAVE|nr:hypothetical protein AVEN_6511-1 [Araneus ventricosus]
MAPHVFRQIRIELVLHLFCSLAPKLGFDCTPGSFDSVGMDARYGIFEVHRMVDGVVHVALLHQRSVGLPAVEKNSGPRLNMFFGDFDQRLCRSILNHAKETFSLHPLSIPPNTHFPSTLLPLWYFLFPNLLSSIST